MNTKRNSKQKKTNSGDLIMVKNEKIYKNTNF